MKSSNGRRSSMLSGVGDASSQQHGTAAVHRSHLQAPGDRRTTLASMSDAPSNSINLEVLRHLQGVFRKADQDGSGQLDMDEFVEAFRGVINTPEGSDDEALRKLFMRIDANCDAAVDWDEFSAYLLLEKTTSTGGPALPGSTAAAAAGGVPELAYNPVDVPAATSTAAHRDLISGVMHVDTGMGPDRWYSSARDGTVKVWNGKDLSPLRTLQTPLQCITCSAFTPCSNLLALGSYSANVLLLDPSTGDQAGLLVDAGRSAAVSVVGWREGGDGILDSSAVRELMVVGDADGGVNMIHVQQESTADRKNKTRYKGTTLWRAQNHHDWVVCVRHMPQLNSILAASLDKKLTMTDTERCIAVKTLEGHQKSVTCCAWSGMYKMAISGSADKQVMLWNPFSCRPMGTLTGHAAGIVAMTLNEHDHQIITAAEDKTLKVWDLRNQLCLQTLVDGSTYTPDNTLSALTYSPARKMLVSGAYYIKPWPLTDTRGTGGAGHRDPVSWVAYNHMFAEVVSTDHAGMVCVWHVATGRLRFCYGNTHGGARISAATFDRNYRRLITGSDDGQVKVWNFSSGVLLSTLATPQSGSVSGTGLGAEVTGLLVSSNNNEQNIIVTGWDRKVSWYDDSGKRVGKLLRSSSGPSTDVLSAAIMEGYPTLATACYDGEVCLWNVESGAVRRKLVVSGHADKPESEQPVEKLMFMKGDLRHILVAVGADRMLRFWDCFSGVCVVAHFTGHKQGESVVALTLAPDNMTLVTADTAGYIMVWDISQLRLPSVNKSQARPSMVTHLAHPPPHGVTCSTGWGASTAASTNIHRVAVWRGHSDAVTALDWVVAPTPEAEAAAREAAVLSAAEHHGAAEAAQAAVEGLRHEHTAAPATHASSACHGEPAAAEHLAGDTAVRQHDGHNEQSRNVGNNLVHQQQTQCHPHHGPVPSAGYMVSGSLDGRLSLWSSSGALVGVFGRDSWSLQQPETWQHRKRREPKASERFDILVSAHMVEIEQPTSPSQPAPHGHQSDKPLRQVQADQQIPASGSCGANPAHVNTSISRPHSAGIVTGEPHHHHTPTLAVTGSRPSTAASSCVTSRISASRPVTAGSRQPSRPSSACEALLSDPHRQPQSSQQQHCNTRITGSSASASGASSAAGSRAMTPVEESDASVSSSTDAKAVALVCQLSMKHRANTIRTLGSLKEQHSPDMEAFIDSGVVGKDEYEQLNEPEAVTDNSPCSTDNQTWIQEVGEQECHNQQQDGSVLQQGCIVDCILDTKQQQLKRARAAIAAVRQQRRQQQQQASLSQAADNSSSQAKSGADTVTSLAWEQAAGQLTRHQAHGHQTSRTLSVRQQPGKLVGNGTGDNTAHATDSEIVPAAVQLLQSMQLHKCPDSASAQCLGHASYAAVIGRASRPASAAAGCAAYKRAE